MKLLLTGVTGFLGSHVAERLAASGHEVRCLVRSPRAALPEDMVRRGIELCPVDFSRLDALADAFDGIERVYHIAGTTRARTINEYYEGNWALTKRMAEACIQSGAKIDRFVYVSSLSAVGPSDDGPVPDESAAYHPVSHYGKSKMLAEQELRTKGELLRFVIVRPGAIYGPRERDLFLYFRLIQKGIYPRIGRARRYLNLAHCDDVVRGIILAGESERASGKIYFIASDRVYTTDEIAGAIAEAVGVKACPITVPEAAVWALGLLSELRGRTSHAPVFFNIQKAREACALSWNCSIERARDELGYRPQVSLTDGIRRTYQWYLDQGLLAARKRDFLKTEKSPSSGVLTSL